MSGIEDARSPDKHGDGAALDISDRIASYIELALKIYLRVKSEGHSIHSPQFDDEIDPL
jgi:hypothetical protein